MADTPDDVRFAELVCMFRHPAACPDPAVHSLVLEGLTIAARVLNDRGQAMTRAERDAWLTGVRTLHLAGLAAVGPPSGHWH